ncbi:hypothetical protein BOX15_Mlig008649g2, partial [Macrostomum lignano]
RCNFLGGQLLLLALLLTLLGRPSSQLELNCSGGHLPPVGPGVDHLEVVANAASAPASCQLSVTAASGAGRWYLWLESSSGADGDLVVRDGADVTAWSGTSQLNSAILERKLIRSGAFSLDLTLRVGHLTLRADLVAPSACPPASDGWSMPWPGGCLMVSAGTNNFLSFMDAQHACERVGANLFTTSASDPTAWALSYLFFGNRLRTGFGYWIGARLTAEGNWAYINGSRLLVGSTLPPYKYDCGRSVAACQCALYREAQLYRNDCSDRRPFICAAPPGGTFDFFSAHSANCVDCRSAVVTVSVSDEFAESGRRMYFYLVSICVVILAAITAGVIACFVHSVRRWRIDAKLAARRPPDYELDDGPPNFPVSPASIDLESEPPVYDGFVEAGLPANQNPPTAL